MLDLSVSGSWGLYSIAALTPRGEQWLARHCPAGPDHTYVNGALACEGGDRCRALVAAADRARLAVEVNGVDMAGFGRRARA